MTQCICMVLLLISSAASWSMRFNQDKLYVLQGSDPELTADEGYLYLSFEAETPFSTLLLEHVESGRNMRFTHVQPGANHALVQLKAGTYYWKQIRTPTDYGLTRMKFDQTDFMFRIKPGVVNYVGNWVAGIHWYFNQPIYRMFKSNNEASTDRQRFQQHYQKFTGPRPFEYAGHSPDPYAAHMDKMMAKTNFINRQKIIFHEGPLAELPIGFFDIEEGVDEQLRQFPRLLDYLQDDDHSLGEINPQGQWVLLGSKQNQDTVVEVVNIKSKKSYVIYQERLPHRVQIKRLTWLDDNTFLLNLDYQNHSFSQVFHLYFNSVEDMVGAEVVEVPMAGELINPLIHLGNKMLFANYRLDLVAGENLNGLYMVDTSDIKSMTQSFKQKHVLSRPFERVVDWLTDVNGQVRSAIEVTYDESLEQVVYHHWFLAKPDHPDWVKMATYTNPNSVPQPVMLSADGRHFYAFTDAYGDKVALHQFSSKDYSHAGPFYVDADFDMISLIQDPGTHLPVGYERIENGLVKRRFFSQHHDRIHQLRAENPELQLTVRQHSATTGLMLIHGTTAFSKGSWYLYDEKTKRINKLKDESPAYEKLPKGDNIDLTMVTDDGVTIEGYLVLPSIRNDSKIPLVVTPHGGPIGVRDLASNDGIQHFFASKGIATLKVNYRGSGGYGRAFQALGNQQWGEKIEADIHGMVLHAAANHNLDLSKVCAMGGSYGGYSAVMLTHLYPDVYQCAVSIAGVMDLPLLFTGAVVGMPPGGYADLAEIVGNPSTDLLKMMQKSPFYIADQLTKPIKLFHGVNDETVTLEHALRMQQAFTVLNLAGDLTILNNEAHSMTHLNSNIFYVAESLKFIDEKLGLKLE